MKTEPSHSSTKYIEHLTKIGVALSAQRDINRLLEMIIDEACDLTKADGGTLYTMSPDGNALEFAIVLNKTLGIHRGGAGEKIDWPPVRLMKSAARRNMANVSAYAVHTGRVVNIPDVYNAAGFNFRGTREFDARTGYRSRSMLVVPMRNHEGDVIGVLQLLNAKGAKTGRVIPFSPESVMITESFASQAAVALSQNRLIKNLEELLEAFVKTIALAIDEKSPYTGGHIRRVADITMAIAEKINHATEGPFAHFRFSADQLQELRMAAWLHDLGKIATPEHVVDKATKLETIYDRLEVIRLRGEIMIRDHELALLRAVGPSHACKHDETPRNDDAFARRLHDDMAFLEAVNRGSKSLSEEERARLQQIHTYKWMRDGREEPLLHDDEYHNLCISRGTLNAAEREIVDNHALVTEKLLGQLPFPKRLKNIPAYAGSHHEKLDGSGYPRGLKGEAISLQTRIIALADVFEALTAKDRPYKQANTLSEAVKILRQMAETGHIDADLFSLFMEEKIYLDYALRELPPRQIDRTDLAF
ncbi:MAG: GAF domain-containing protein [Syntrophobacterales bacterium]|nr:GAF domain-containing protein [Syntrophobacterales bacterium]